MKLLAQRLLTIFPKIINDFYICDEYYGYICTYIMCAYNIYVLHKYFLGETALHMGVVSENPEIVRHLLKSGADVDVRCTGNFFTCDDQKSTRNDW